MKLTTVLKKIVNTGFLVVFVFGLVTGFISVHLVYLPVGNRLYELEKQAILLQDDLSSKNAQISNLLEEIEYKKMNLSDLQSELDIKKEENVGLNAQINELNSNVTDLQTQITVLEEDIVNLQQTKDSQITNLQQIVLDLESEIVELEETLKMKIDVLETSFSPRGGCENTVLNWINRANISIHVLMYTFNRESIGDSILNAYNRGLDIKIVLEESRITPLSQYERLTAAGIQIRNDTNVRNMNNRIVIIDSVIVLTGSYDWTNDAESFNDENLIAIKSSGIGDIYEQNFMKIWNKG